MRVLRVRNVHDALPLGLQLLSEEGVRRPSRAGEVLVAPFPVTTVYERPWERVIFWPERDANPAFHLYESLWMLAGRKDLAPLLRYVKTFGKFSDDGDTLHGAYGWRWRRFGGDQLLTICRRLTSDPYDRRCVLSMWDPNRDLDREGRDVPCNLTATFQIGPDDKLHLTVFCRSNDAIWGAYGANAVHFSMLMEHVASKIGAEMGTYTQVSVNFHAYVNVISRLTDVVNGLSSPSPSLAQQSQNPYTSGQVTWVPMGRTLLHGISELVDEEMWQDLCSCGDWYRMVARVMHAHHLWRTLAAPERFDAPLDMLDDNSNEDFVVAMREWLIRRRNKWENKAQ